MVLSGTLPISSTSSANGGGTALKTANDWLANFDRNGGEIDRVLRKCYGGDAALWRPRWRLFLLATGGLFGYNDGKEWGVSHYRLRPVR